MRWRTLLTAAVALAMALGGVALTVGDGAGDMGRSSPAQSSPGQSSPGGDGTAGGAGADPDGGARSSPPAPTTPPLVDADRPIHVDAVGEFFGWALRDRHTGDETGSEHWHQTTSTESLIKVWVVGDHLRRLTEAGQRPTARDLRDGRVAIRDSNNDTTQRMYVEGGGDRVVERMVETCGLRDTHIPEHGHGWWSRTEMSPRDAVRLGECVADGRAAGPEWTDWLLTQMRQVRGTTAPADQRAHEGFEGGRWGIIDGLPPRVADQVAIKNGWTRIDRTDSWHVSCLAVTDDWVLAVMMRYPAGYPLDYGADRCAEVASQTIGQSLADPGQVSPR